MSREELARRQAALVAALVRGAPPPPDMELARVRAAAVALLRKRAGEVARVWPLLAASHGPQWSDVFVDWAAGRPPVGALRDGWDLARAQRVGTVESPTGPIAEAAAGELAERERLWRYDGVSAPRRRRFRRSKALPI